MDGENRLTAEDWDAIMTTPLRVWTPAEAFAHIQSEIAAYEAEYGFPSAELSDRLSNGLQETHAICSWMSAVKIRERYKHNFTEE